MCGSAGWPTSLQHLHLPWSSIALGFSHVILYSGLTLQWRTLEPVLIPKSWPHQWTVVPRSTPAPSSMHSNPPPPSLSVNLLPCLESRVNFKEYNSCFPGCYSHPHCVTWPFYLLLFTGTFALESDKVVYGLVFPIRTFDILYVQVNPITWEISWRHREEKTEYLNVQRHEDYSLSIAGLQAETQ